MKMFRPKKKWVPKSPPLVFDIGVALTKRERVSALVVDACEARRTYHIDASLSRKFGGRTTIVWRLRE